ncbi:MAG: hypothetical protein HYY25_10400 [Candidatus Wallbacteria bacterium]|nr:hypothetical protein [Candidatus Wallbacteria bacterium]
MNRSLAWAFVAALLAYSIAFALVADFTSDDAGISFCYAKNLAAGRGLVLTAGSERVEGFSNLLWVLLLAPGIGLGLDPALLAKALAFAAGSASLCLLLLAPARMAGRPLRTSDAVPPLLLATSAPFAFWTAGGLETILFTLVLLAAATAFALELRTPPRTFPLSALALFLASLTRPEGPLYALAALPAMAARALAAPDRAGNWRHFIRWLLWFVAALAAFFVWRQLYFGSWWPTVFHTKLPGNSLSSLGLAGAGWHYLMDWLSAPSAAALTALAAWGLWRLPAARGGLWLGGSLAATAAFAVVTGGDWMQHHRFLVPALPFLCWAAGEGLYHIDSVLPASLPSPRATAAPITCLLLLTAYGAAQLGALHATRGRYRVTFSSRLARGEIFGRMAREAGLQSALLADADAGGTSWASGLELLDITGLTDRILSRHLTNPVLREEYIFGQRRPDFIRLSGVWTEASGLGRSSRLAAEYLPLAPLPGDYPGDTNFARRELLLAGDGEPPELQLAQPPGPGVSLAGLTPAARVVAPGGRIVAHLYWTMTAGAEPRVRLGLSGIPTTFVERRLARGWLAPEAVPAGATMCDRLLLPLPESLPQGRYSLELTASPASPVTSVRGLELLVSRGAARARAQELVATFDAAGGVSRSRLLRDIEELETAGALDGPSLESARRAAGAALARQAIRELEGPVESVVEAIECCLLAARWEEPATAARTAVATRAMAAARSLESRGDALGACRLLGAVARIAPGDARMLAWRDRLWKQLADATTRPGS